MHRLTLSWFVVILIGWCGNVPASAYRWVDAQGVVHFGQAPPPGTAARGIETRPPPGPGATDGDLESRAEQLEERREIDRAQKAQRAQGRRQSEIRRQNCDAARRNRQKLESRGRVKVKVGDRYRYFTEQERQEAISAARARIDDYCHPADVRSP